MKINWIETVQLKRNRNKNEKKNWNQNQLCLPPSQHAGRRSASGNCFWSLMRTCFQSVWRLHGQKAQSHNKSTVETRGIFWKWTVPSWKNSELAGVRQTCRVVFAGEGDGGTCPGQWSSRFGTKWPIICWCATATRSCPLSDFAYHLVCCTFCRYGKNWNWNKLKLI